MRIERGRPRYGVELDEGVIPQEAGSNERAVSFEKGCYVGQETVARLHYRGQAEPAPSRAARCQPRSSPGRRSPLNDSEVGRVASATVSPRFGPIALALVRREAEPGSTVAVGDELTAQVVELPFG